MREDHTTQAGGDVTVIYQKMVEVMMLHNSLPVMVQVLLLDLITISSR